MATFALHKWEAILSLLQRDNAQKEKALAMTVLEEARSALDCTDIEEGSVPLILNCSARSGDVKYHPKRAQGRTAVMHSVAR